MQHHYGMSRNQFAAPWSGLLKGVSFGATLLLVGVSLLIWFNLPPSPSALRAMLSMTLLLMPLICALFLVRGYRIEGRHLIVRRLFWETRISLEGLRDAAADPEAMRRSLRICGNGGLFSFTGWYRSKRLGTFRAYVTDLHRTVVLTFPNRKIVVSPDRPEPFVEAVLGRRPSKG